MMHLRNRAANGSRPYDGLDQLFEDMTRGLQPLYADENLKPSLDVFETAGEWRVKAELPGVAIEDVEVSVVGNVLTIRGEKKNETTPEGESGRRAERRFGKFARTLEFPSDVDATKVEARAKNGVLTVTLPKAEKSMPRTIAVKGE